MKNKALRESYYRQPCTICQQTPSDPAHIKSYGSSGIDHDTNLLPLCRRHHSMQHMIGWRCMAEKFPLLYEALATRGWALDERGKLIRVDSEPEG